MSAASLTRTLVPLFIGLLLASPLFGEPTMPTTTPATSPTTVTQEQYRGLPAYRMSNGVVELIAVPQTGRISRFAFVGGANVLWDNPKPKDPNDPNYNDGGDKVWVWPQSEWPQRIGRGWPGPDATDLPYEPSIINDGQTLRLTSRVFTGYGVRAVRDITLQGAAARIQTRFVKVEDGFDFPLAAWTVSELPFPSAIAARLIPQNTLPDGYRQDTKWGTVTDWKVTSAPSDPQVRLIDRPTTTGGKIFLDADILAAVVDDVAFVQHVQRQPNEAGYTPGDRAQVYTQARETDAPFIELEFTSPLVTLQRDQTVSLDIVWELHRIDPGEPQVRTDPTKPQAELVRLLSSR